MKMSDQQKEYTPQYPSLMVTVKCEPQDRSVAETYFNSRARRSKEHYRPSSFQPRNIYYNSNHFTRPPSTSSRRQQTQYYQSYEHIDDQHHQPQHYQHLSIRPLMEIKDNRVSLHYDYDQDANMTYQDYAHKEPKQRGQYRNRKAELDWDHAFDLDLIDLYTTTTNIDADRHSLTSTIM
jgi:hypothetical protein